MNAQQATAAVSANRSASLTQAPGQYLTFLLDDEVFALGLRSVREIIQVCPMTIVPRMPDFVRGVINLRGAVVPVIDLHARFGRPSADVSKKTCIVIFDCLRDGKAMELGLLVDAVSEVLDLPTESIEPPPTFGVAGRQEFVCGLGKRDSRFVIILDPDRAFDVGLPPC
jgi:purine-binding chemotaxis protein CheW